ncbi:hypothetical protein L7F22_046042 [Adiantum nelumboides]|nr:hypothetical protein [Adiantum nelumboides]
MGLEGQADLACPGHSVPVTPILGKLRMHIQSYVDTEEFYIMPLEGCDVLLGMPWCHRKHAVLDAFNRKITLVHRDRTLTLDVKLKGESVPVVSASAISSVMKSHLSAYLILQSHYEMEFTVDSKYKAVSSGKLLYKVEKGSHLVTYVYNLDIPVAARFISLVVAPLKSQLDQQNASISNFCIPSKVSHLQCTVSFFSSLFSFYEDYLGASFPFGSYNHVFIDSELMMMSSSVGAAMTILNSHLMVDERIIDQTMNTRIKLAHALAQQWFGVYISPESPNDGIDR